MKELLHRKRLPGRGRELEHVVRRAGDSSGDGPLRVLTLNLRHGRGGERGLWPLTAKEYRENADAAAAFLAANPADVTALQEADAPSTWSGSFHHVEHLAKETDAAEFALGIHFSMNQPFLELSYGTALLSRRPLLDTDSAAFAARPIDTKGYVIAAVEHGGRVLDVASVHLDVVFPVRRRQVADLVERFKQRRRPLVLMGDLNCSGLRGWSVVRKLTRELGLSAPAPVPTYPTWRPTRHIDWILISGELAMKDFRVVPHEVSDHLALSAAIDWA